MKKGLCLLLAALWLPACALAQEDAATANGVVESAETWEVVAPCSGVLLDFDWERGDAVRADDELFVLDTQKVYAPEDGTLTALFVEQGELCEDAAARYGMVAAIERDCPLVVTATTRGAYNQRQNKLLHMGQRVWFKQSGSGANTGAGAIVAIDGERYTVEADAGDFEPGDPVKLYREQAMGSKAYIGQGAVERARDVSVQAGGRVVRLCAAEGQRVTKGQLLMELVAADADSSIASAGIRAGRDGALLAVKAAPGQQVYKGMSLATVGSLTDLRVVAEVDEIDLNGVKLGARLKLAFDRYPGEEFEGVVTRVSRVGAPKQNAAYYNVELSIQPGAEALPGMNATVYIPAGLE